MSSTLHRPTEELARVEPDRSAIERFVYREARLQDEHRYDEWESLWADDGVYWVPANEDDLDPATQVSYIYDNRTRLAGRIRQLKSGRRHAQSPPSRLRRVVSNLEVEVAGPLVQVHANFMLVEIRNGRRTVWCGRTRYDLRPTDDGYRMVLKKVMLVDNEEAIPNLGFLI
jgi:3-phenylpropionate/cinnamic acid dioxygenase small subunit